MASSRRRARSWVGSLAYWLLFALAVVAIWVVVPEPARAQPVDPPAGAGRTTEGPRP